MSGESVFRVYYILNLLLYDVFIIIIFNIRDFSQMCWIPIEVYLSTNIVQQYTWFKHISYFNHGRVYQHNDFTNRMNTLNRENGSNNGITIWIIIIKINIYMAQNSLNY